MERALSRTWLLSRARLTRVLAERLYAGYFVKAFYLQLAVVSWPANIKVMTSDAISSSDKPFPLSS